MPLLLLLGGSSSAPASLLDDGALGVFLVGPTGGSKTRIDYVDMRIRGGRFGNGEGSFTVPASSPIVALFAGTTAGAEYMHDTLRVFYNNATTPLWTGIMAGATMSSAGDEGTVEIVFEQAYGHALRRRLLTKTLQGSEEIPAGSIAADNLVLSLMRNAMGPPPVEPTGYPASADRDDFGNFTFSVAAAHSPAQSPTLPAVAEQSGNNLFDLIPEMGEMWDLAALTTDNQDQTYTLDVAYPFATDVSDTVVFSSWLGNLTNFEAVAEKKSMVNVLSIEGATSGGSHTYAENATSRADWGPYEGHAQKPQATDNTGAISTMATWITTRFGNGTQSYRAEIVQRSGSMFNVDWGLRSTVRFVEAVHGYDFDQTCVEFELQAQDGGPPELSVTFGQARLNTDTLVAAWTGTPGPRMGGNPWHSKRQ